MDNVGETFDGVIYHDLTVVQNKRGYRFSIDSVLLAGFIDSLPPGPLIDLGCASGILSLLAARRWPDLFVVGLDIQAVLMEKARLSIRLSGLEGRISLVRGDLRQCRNFLRPASFGTALCNPPYLKAGMGRLPKDEEKALARHELNMNLENLLDALVYLLPQEGHFFITWKPERSDELQKGLKIRGLEIATMRHVISRRGDEPYLTLFHGLCRPHGRLKTSVQQSLIIYDGDHYSREVDFLLSRGYLPRGKQILKKKV